MDEHSVGESWSRKWNVGMGRGGDEMPKPFTTLARSSGKLFGREAQFVDHTVDAGFEGGEPGQAIFGALIGNYAGKFGLSIDEFELCLATALFLNASLEGDDMAWGLIDNG